MQAAHYATEAHEAGLPTIADALSDLYAFLPRLSSDAHGSDIDAAVNELVERLSRFGAMAGTLGLMGLQNVQARLTERLLPFARAESLPADLVTSLEEWLQLNFNYLADPSVNAYWLPLIEFLNRPIWGDELSSGQAAIINRLFEVSALQKTESLLTTPESAEPLIDDKAADVISASLDEIAVSGQIPLLDIAVWNDAPGNDISREDQSREDQSNNDNDVKKEEMLEDPVLAAPADEDNLVMDEATESSADSDRDADALDIPPSVAELVALIREELAGSEEALQGVLQIASASALAGDRPSLEDYRWHLERLASATEAVGLVGLHGFMTRVLESTHLAETGDAQGFCRHCDALDRWPALVSGYLTRLGHADASQALVDYVSRLEFALPLEDARELFDSLHAPKLDAVVPETPARPTQATDEQVDLAVPDDINPGLLESMLQELPSQTQEFSAALQRIASGTGELDDVRVAQRIAHTLKGSANTVGIRGIAEFAHHLEDIFLALQEREALPPKALARVLVDAADCLEAMSDALIGVAPVPSQSLNVLQEILDWANRIDRDGLQIDVEPTSAIAPAENPAESIVVDESTSQIVQALPVHTPASPASPLSVEPQPDSAALPSLRVPTNHIDDLLRLSGESKIVGSQLKEGLRRVDSQLQAVRRQSQLFQQLVNELEQLVDIRGITMPRLSMSRRGDTEFDALELDQYSELHTVSRRLAEVAMDSREWSAAAQGELRTLEDLLLSQARHSNETQGAILRMRMVPATTIVGRLQRAVRQTCRLLDKDVELVVTGADTLIDSDSLNQLVDPLMHLMRNAIDHGIESAEQRVASGKAPQGRLIVEFGREGNQISIRCIDDGRGLDYAAIRLTAEMRGFIGADSVLSDAQLGRLIFEPGFSTRTEVTQTSGRGIGLDIVHNRVAELKGTFDVHSEGGRGCRFVIRLPATLISAHALLVKHDKHTVAIASRGVRQILDAQAGVLTSIGNRLSLQVGGEVYEAYRLETLLGNANSSGDAERGPRPALLIEVSADRVCAILVQAVIDTIDLVVKPLGPFVPKSTGLIGATILGDGGVAPVMDLPDLLRAGKRERSLATAGAFADNRLAERRANQARLPSVLVIDDSLSVRRSMEQLLLDAGYEVRLARDGLEAVAILDVKKPDLILVDLEMPRMNGMELTTHVRNRVETRDLPVIMITSRATEKHRKQAEAAGVNLYMTKPYTEDALLQHMTALLPHSV